MEKHYAYFIRLKDNKYISVWCENSRNGFRHIAELWENNVFIRSARKSYINRTWERFTYETVLRQLLADSNLHEIEAMLNQAHHLDDFKMIVENK